MEHVDQETEKYIREGKALQVKALLTSEVFTALGGSFPETTINRIVDKIDKVYFGTEEV